MKKIYAIILLFSCGIVYSANFNTRSYRPDFIKISPQKLSNEHRASFEKKYDQAFVNAVYININNLGLKFIKGDNGKFYNTNNKNVTGQNFSIRLPGTNKLIELHVETVQNLILDEDISTYTGYLSDDTSSKFVLSISDDIVLGNISYGKYKYIVTPIKIKDFSVKHVIVQIDGTYMQKDDSKDFVESIANQTSNVVEKSSSDGTGNVDVLFYAASNIFWPSYHASNIVAYTNGVLSDSGVSSNNFISSVGVKVLASSLSGLCKYPLFNQIENRQGVFSSLNQDLNTNGADIMFLLVTTQPNMNCTASPPAGDSVPWGRRGGLAYKYTSSQPFALSTDTYAINDLTAIHELGHVFGGVHNSESRPNYGFEGNNRGVTENTGDWQTIMGAYDWTKGCDFTLNVNTIACERIGYFSNPSKSYNGVSIGSSSRNMKSYLQTKMPIVSSWYTAPIPPPAAPNPIHSASGACFGFNSVLWTSQAGATSYKLYKSTSSSFTSPVLLYNGSSTSTFINVNSGTWYLRAQACNSSGCSTYSNQVSATRINACL